MPHAPTQWVLTVAHLNYSHGRPSKHATSRLPCILPPVAPVSWFYDSWLIKSLNTTAWLLRSCAICLPLSPTHLLVSPHCSTRSPSAPETRNHSLPLPPAALPGIIHRPLLQLLYLQSHSFLPLSLLLCFPSPLAFLTHQTISNSLSRVSQSQGRLGGSVS